MTPVATARIVRIPPSECIHLLATMTVGRLGFVHEGGPEVLPVNYVLDGDAVVFATNTGMKLWGSTRGRVVFEVDQTDPVTRSGWSVVVHGLAQEVPPGPCRAAGGAAPPAVGRR
jgi:nitroimidazol reductase NimA-like FMN-containing flavoprotein (pyridoxamine 5'-phosphate oxidase superfamily)